MQVTVQSKTPADRLTCGCLVLATSYSRTAYRRTTIGAAAFHCRVRNGNGWRHCAIITRVRSRIGGNRCYRSDASARPSLWGPVDLRRSGSPRLIVRSLDFARDDKIFSKNASSLASTYRKHFPILDSRVTIHESVPTQGFVFFFKDHSSSICCCADRNRRKRVMEK